MFAAEAEVEVEEGGCCGEADAVGYGGEVWLEGFEEVGVKGGDAVKVAAFGGGF